jgi:hypothetical protein
MRVVRQHGVSEEDEDISNQLQQVARLQQNGHRMSYSPVSFMLQLYESCTDKLSLPPLDLRLHITTLPYPTRPPRKDGQTHNHATRRLRDLRKSRYTELLEHRQCHHRCRQSPQHTMRASTIHGLRLSQARSHKMRHIYQAKYPIKDH